MTDIVCGKCDELKSKACFYDNNGYSCKKCISAYNKTRLIARRENLQRWKIDNKERYKELCNKAKAKKLPKLNKIIDEAKNNFCVDCGIKYPAKMMDFDHLGDKKYKISQFRSMPKSIKSLKEELAKCELVCACCHRLRTFKRRELENTQNPQPDQQRVRNLQKWVNDKFKSKPCTKCKKTFEPCQMDLDHLDPSTKLKSVSELVNRRASYKRIEAEAAKCQLLCANCHRLVD